MGLLDDAIREHLELKRSRGADAQEITRQEREAFGSARSGEPAAPAQPQEHAETHPDDHAGAVPTTPPAHEPPEPEAIPEPPVVEAELPEPPVETEPPAEADEPAARAEPADVPPPPTRETGVLEDDDIDWSDPAPRDEEPPADEAASDEDVLEETPEFLQETPEHDRLWFEQKPPKDFDF